MSELIKKWNKIGNVDTLDNFDNLLGSKKILDFIKSGCLKVAKTMMLGVVLVGSGLGQGFATNW